MLTKCPKCQRFTIEHDSQDGVKKCLATDCLWTSREESQPAKTGRLRSYMLSQELASRPHLNATQ